MSATKASATSAGSSIGFRIDRAKAPARSYKQCRFSPSRSRALMLRSQCFAMQHVYFLKDSTFW
jgi:hypothetical protein